MVPLKHVICYLQRYTRWCHSLPPIKVSCVIRAITVPASGCKERSLPVSACSRLPERHHYEFGVSVAERVTRCPIPSLFAAPGKTAPSPADSRTTVPLRRRHRQRLFSVLCEETKAHVEEGLSRKTAQKPACEQKAAFEVAAKFSAWLSAPLTVMAFRASDKQWRSR